MALISSRFTWPGVPASASARSCPEARSRTRSAKSCCSDVSANAVTGHLPAGRGRRGRHRACAVPGTPARISSSRGRGPSVRPPCGLRLPAANGIGQVAPGPAYPCSAAACRVHCGSYRWVRPSAHRSARPARISEFTSS